MNIPFSPPDISVLEIKLVTEVLSSNWITTGPKTKLLEDKLASWLGTFYCVCLNSQTSCAEMTLRLLGVGEGDEVITTAYTYTATASVVCHVGAKLVLVDTQKDGLEMDYEALEKAITEKTKVVIPVDMGGVPCDYDRIYEIVKRKSNLFKPNNDLQRSIGRVVVVADSAHALGAEYKGKKIGTVADFTNFSFHAVKNLTTGEGGAMTWRHIEGVDDEDLYKKVQLLSLHGQTKCAFEKTKLGAWEYDIEGTWYKCNMTDISAALGLAQFERYPYMLRKRRKIIETYDEAFKPLGINVLDHFTKDYSSSGHLYITRVPNITDLQRREIIFKMAEKGVSCNVHYKPLPMYTAYKNLGFDIKDFPNAYNYYENEITLPLYSRLTDLEIEYVIDNYKAILSKYIK